MRRKNRKDVMIVALLSIMIFMTVGYSVLTSNIDDGGKITVQKNTWNVEFERVASIATSGEVIAETPIFSNNKVTFDAKLNIPGDSISYDIIVANNGRLDAEVLEIIQLPKDTEKAIMQNLDGIEVGEILKAGEKRTISITVSYNEEVEPLDEGIEEQFSYTLKFNQYEG